jgi:hypothetical protein
MKKQILFVAVIALFLVSSCMPGHNTGEHIANADGTLAGFWLGLWHGLIAPVTFVISLFKNSVNVYEVHNNGGWYNFGFVLGLCITFGGSGNASSRRK